MCNTNKNWFDNGCKPVQVMSSYHLSIDLSGGVTELPERRGVGWRWVVVVLEALVRRRRRQPLETRHHFYQETFWHLPRSHWWKRTCMLGPQAEMFPSSSGSLSRLWHLLELFGDFPQGSVYLELWPLAEGLFAQRTLVSLCNLLSSSAVPVKREAGLAEAVATRGGDWVVEHFQAYWTGELVFREKGRGKSHGRSIWIKDTLIRWKD